MTLIKHATDLVTDAFAKTEKTTEHSFKVFEILKNRFGVEDAELLAAGLCHDLLEDTEVTADELENRTSKRVASIVKEISHSKGVSRAEKMELYRSLPSVSDDAKLVKLADYLANLEWNIEVIQNNELERYPFLKDPDEYMKALAVFLDSCREAYPRETVLVARAMEEVESLHA